MMQTSSKENKNLSPGVGEHSIWKKGLRPVHKSHPLAHPFPEHILVFEVPTEEAEPMI